MSDSKGLSVKGWLLALVVLAGIGTAIVYAVTRSSTAAGKDAKTTTGRFIPGNVDTIGGLKLQAIFDSKLLLSLGVRDVVPMEDLPLPPEIRQVLRNTKLELPQITSITLGGRSLAKGKEHGGQWIVVIKGDLDKQVIEDGLSAGLSEAPEKVEDLNVFRTSFGAIFLSNQKELVMGSRGLVGEGLQVYTGDIPSMDVNQAMGEVAAGVNKDAVFWVASKLDVPTKLPSVVLVDLDPFTKITHGAVSGDIKGEQVHLKMALRVSEDAYAHALKRTIDDLTGKLVTAMVFIPGTGPLKTFLRGLDVSISGRRVVLAGTVKMHDIRRVFRGFRKLKSLF